MKNFLIQLIQLIEIVDSRDNQKSQTSVDLKKDVAESYLKQKSLIGTNQVFTYLKSQFEDDIKLYILLLSVIFECHHDESILIEAYDTLIENDLDIFDELMIRHQIVAKAFYYGAEKSEVEMYKKKRKLNQKMLDKLNALVKFDKPYVPLKKRNQNRIVIVTNQLLSDNHAPTRIVKEICHCLQRYLNMEVFLIIASEEYNYLEIKERWINPRILNYGEDVEGYVTLNCFQEEIKGFKFKMNRNSIARIKRVLNIVYGFNPLCIWYMGGVTLFADLLRNSNTVLGMPFSKNFAVSEASILIRYLKGEKEVSQRLVNYVLEQKQKIVDMRIPYKAKMSKQYSLQELEIPKDAYPLLIVGNRLDGDITTEFLCTLKKILQIHNSIHLVFIGIFNNYAEVMYEEIVNGRSTNLGYREDLMDSMNIGKLFLNPPRQGGGAGGVNALYQGIPVITLANNDIASAVGEEFVCKDLEEMICLVEKYITDEEFYMCQSKIAIEKANKEDNISLEKEILNLIEAVKKEIVELEGENK